MGKPHIHAELIKAWADGEKIEYFSIIRKKWIERVEPAWAAGSKYRIKPKVKTIKFRCYLNTTFGAPHIYAVTWKTYQALLEPNPHWDNIQWLGDWQEYVIEENQHKIIPRLDLPSKQECTAHKCHCNKCF